MNIYKFLKGLEPDDKGRLIHQIWDFSDAEIEQTHDFIQRIFPLNEPSTMSLNKFYVEDVALIERIRIDPIITNNFIASKNFFLGVKTSRVLFTFGEGLKLLGSISIIFSIFIFQFDKIDNLP